MSSRRIELPMIAITIAFAIMIAASATVFETPYISHYRNGLGINRNNILTIIDSSAILFQTAYAQPQHQEFRAKMAGSQEVPPKNSAATGTVAFEPTPGQMTLSYKITLSNIDKVTMAHIHKGKVGENGPIIVTLFNSPSSPTGKLNGNNNTLVQGNIRADSLEGLLAGKGVPDLIKMIKDNDTYVNVHTVQNPKGEIRGQVVPVS